MTVAQESPQLSLLSDDDVLGVAHAAKETADAIESEASPARWVQADAYAELVGRGWTQQRIAGRAKVSQTTVSFYVRCTDIRYLIDGERGKFYDVYAIVSGEKPDLKDRIAKSAGGAHEGTATSAGDTFGEGWKLLLGDFRARLLELPPGSVNLIVTDPPYPEEFLPLWEDLGREASRLLVAGGVMAARCGHLFLPQVLNMLGAYLQYGWVYCEPLPGSNVRFLGRKIAVSYQPWVMFSNGPWPSGSIDWNPDTFTQSPRAKSRYVWEQSPGPPTEIMATFTEPGHDVLDPFAGSGTYGEAALGVGCRWIGVELDPAGHAQATERLGAL